MTVDRVEDARAAREAARQIRTEARIALDCEAAGYHRYSDRLCLLQLSTPSRTYLIDPLAFDPSDALRAALEDPGTTVVMHGADYDLRLLDRDLGIGVRGLFDTQVAASLLGEPAVGLSALVEAHLGIRLSKKHQRADWARRPLPDELVSYAADDTRHLLALADVLEEGLRRRNRLAWAMEEFRLVERVRWEPPADEDPVERVRGARDLTARQVSALREALLWRDRVARRRDRAHFRIAGDQVLLDVVLKGPRTVSELASVPGMSPALARSEGADLIRSLRAVETSPEAELVPYPRRQPGAGRPPPDVEERANRLKAARNRRAQELGIDRGILLSNNLLVEIARHGPGTRQGLSEIPGMRRWQVEAAGDLVLETLTNGG